MNNPIRKVETDQRCVCHNRATHEIDTADGIVYACEFHAYWYRRHASQLGSKARHPSNEETD